MTLGTCDWGCCGLLATGWRYDTASGLLLPACDIHRRNRGDYQLAA